MAIAIAIGVIGLVVIVWGQWAKESNEREYRRYWAERDARAKAERERNRAEAEVRRQAEAEERRRPSEAEQSVFEARALFRKETARDYEPRQCSNSFSGDKLTDRLATLSTERSHSALLFRDYEPLFVYNPAKGRLSFWGEDGRSALRSTKVARAAETSANVGSRRTSTVEAVELAAAPLRLLSEGPTPSKQYRLSGSEAFLVDWAALRRLAH